MLFSSVVFIFLFLPCFFLLYYLVPGRLWKNLLLLLASLFFYAWGEHVYVFLMIFFILMNYVAARVIDRGIRPKTVLIATVALNLALIGVFKYADFFIGILNGLFSLSIPLPHIPLPLGISFFTFQTMSYVIDVYRKDTPVQKNVLLLGEYVSSFPQLVAGPIVRYQTVAEEMLGRTEKFSEFADGLRRFIFGLAKKVLIANAMAGVCNTIFDGAPEQYGAVGAWLGVLAYSLQIYFDFSGYSDMAIGMGHMMGFHFLENFNYPYIARSVTDFWRRWHISLSTFFRDYLYIPLGGNRRKTPRWIFNILVVWLLTGLWHGASWNFVIWGVYYGVILIFEKLVWGKYIRGRVIPHVYTLVLVMFGWMIFRLETPTLIWTTLQAMFGAFGSGGLFFFVGNQILSGVNVLALVFGIAFSAPIGRMLLKKLNQSILGKIVADLLTVALFIASVAMLLSSAYNPFIYFRF